MDYHIYISDYKKKKVYELPMLPEDMPDKTVSVEVNEFRTANKGSYAVMEISPILPGIGKKRTYYLSNTTGKQVIKLIKNAIDKKEPIRLTIARSDGSCFTNTTYAITSFSYHEMRNTDFAVKLSLIQWRKY
ncbi:MAG: hypothetical protein ACOCM8_06060 [Acetivibrio ethanolgignens]